jgi:hypothetical protein
MLARRAGIPARTVHKAVGLDLIESTGGGSIDRPVEITDAEAERVVRAAALPRRYGLAFNLVLRAQRDGRISEAGGRLELRPLPTDQESEAVA